MTVTFFGHKDSPESIISKLKEILSDLIENNSANLFYIGNNGNFDKMAKYVLSELSLKYPHIKYYIVLSRLPTHSYHDFFDKNIETIFPEDVAKSFPKYAISTRNEWMIKKSDIIVSYVTHSFGGAAKSQEIAKKKGKIILNIAENNIQS